MDIGYWCKSAYQSLASASYSVQECAPKRYHRNPGLSPQAQPLLASQTEQTATDHLEIGDSPQHPNEPPAQCDNCAKEHGVYGSAI
ncbi:Uncharacterised protein [Vibrio cholerae]|nr:Uncharacterised protein [Vibrio cholerae]